MKPQKILTRLFDTFHQENIRYCQWKSNDHLTEGLCGITDLDILVDRNQHRQVVAILAEHGFKRGSSGFGLRYPAVEGYIGLDPDTGKMAYIHLHYRLVLGKKRIKEYVFPWEESVLGSRLQDPDTGLYVADPHMEMLLLLTRAALKIRRRDIFLEYLGKKRFIGKWVVQYQWLSARIEADRCQILCRQLLGAQAAEGLLTLLNQEVTLKQLLCFRDAIQKRILLYRTYGRVLTAPIMWAREFFSVVAFLNRRYLGGRLPVIRKGLSCGGIFIVFIGPDGSGKSTLTGEVTKLFSWKIDVFRAYLGAGDGAVAFYRWGLVKIKNMAERLGVLKSKAKAGYKAKKNSNANKKENRIIVWAKTFWALTLAMEKRGKLKNAWKARNQGQIVICDRYPQAQLMGFNDGPLLSHWQNHKSQLKRSISRWEIKPYRWADRNPPDLVVRLNVDLETAKKRDPEMSRDFLKRRIDAVRSFTFGPRTPVIEIDATRPIEAVVLNVKNAIWPFI